MRLIALILFALTAAAQSGRCVTLTWEPSVSAGVESYIIYRSMTSGEDYRTIGRTPRLAFVDRDVRLSTTYYYVVTARSRDSESEPSNEAEAVIPATRGGCVAPRPTKGRVRISGGVKTSQE